MLIIYFILWVKRTAYKPFLVIKILFKEKGIHKFILRRKNLNWNILFYENHDPVAKTMFSNETWERCKRRLVTLLKEKHGIEDNLIIKGAHRTKSAPEGRRKNNYNQELESRTTLYSLSS